MLLGLSELATPICSAALPYMMQALLDGTLPADFGSGGTTPGRPRLAAAPAARGQSGSGAGSAGQEGADQPPRAAAAAAGGAAMPAAGQSASSPRGRKRPRPAAGIEQEAQQAGEREQPPSYRRRQQQEPSAVDELCQAQPRLDRQGELGRGRVSHSSPA